MKASKLSTWHALILAVVFYVLWVNFAYGPIIGTFKRLATPHFVATPDESPKRNDPSAAFRRGVAANDGPPIYMRKIPFSSIAVIGPKDADDNIVPMHHQNLSSGPAVESYYDEHRAVRWRMPEREGGRR